MNLSLLVISTALSVPYPSLILTIILSLSLAFFLPVPLITGAGCVQAPIQDVAQQLLLLI